jgi:hypothetical protein
VFKVIYSPKKNRSNIDYRFKNRIFYLFLNWTNYDILFSFFSHPTSLEVSFGTTEYQHQDSAISNMEITWLLLNNPSLTDERKKSNLYRLSGYLGHDLH